ncbi:MAG: Lrp/AsnC family transcriptional regulator, partial [Thermoproteota archaeon]
MQELDKNELEIIKELVKNPRISDNKISKNTKIPVKTVNRKRKKLEETGIINYYFSINTRKDGLGWFPSRHMYTIKFKLGLSQNKLIREIKEEMNVRTIFTDIIYESHIAEIDGHTGLLLILEGSSD